MDPNSPYQQHQHSFSIPMNQTPRKSSGSSYVSPYALGQSPGSQLLGEARMHAQQQQQQQQGGSLMPPSPMPPAPQEGRREWIPAPLDCEDALQYSPLSSIVPFRETSIIIPLPSINTTGQVPLRDSVGENLLSTLNREATRDASSQTLTQALQEVSGYLRNHQGKVYKFKQPRVLDPSSVPPLDDNFDIPAGIDHLIKKSKLGGFEGLLLKNNQQYIHQTDTDMMTRSSKSRRKSSPKTIDPRNLQSIIPPATPTLQIPSPSPYTATSVTPSALSFQSPLTTTTPYSATPQGVSSFSIHVPQRSSISSASPLQPFHPGVAALSPIQTTTQETPLSTDRRQSVPQYSPGGTRIMESVMINSPPAFDRKAYENHPDVDQKVIAGKGTGMRKRKRALEDEDEDMISGVDYRAKAQQALTSISNLMGNIFNAEDNMQADTSERTTTKTSNYFLTTSYDTESHGPCLTIATQTKLDSVLQKVISAGKFKKLPVDDLTRLQKICENTLKTAEDIEIRITDEILAGDSSAWDSWLGRVGWIDNALRTSMTCLRIMTGGRAEKQLYSEELLQSILNTVKTLLDSCMNQLIEARPSSSQQLFKSASSQRKILNGVLHEIVLVFKLLARFINAEEVTDEFITKMEYICVGIIFIENASHEKDSVFGIQKVENLRAAAMDVLAIIFAKHPDQQKFIFDELLSNLEKLPTSKSGARNFKLASGGDIQLITALILILIQTSGTHRADAKREREIPKLSVHSGNDVGSPSASQSQNVEEDAKNSDDADRYPASIVDGLNILSEKLYQAASRNASYVSSFMIQRAQTSSKTGESPYRNLLDLIINDLLTVLRLPEWPAAELMLRSIELYMVGIVDDPKSQSNPRGMALDVLTTMAVSVCDMRVHIRESRAKGEEHNDFDVMLQELTKAYITLYHEGIGERRDEREELNQALMKWEGPFKLVLEQLWEKDDSSSGSLRSAWGFYATLWSQRLCQSYIALDPEDKDDDEGVEMAKIAVLLRNIMKGNAWYDEQRNLDNFNKATPSAFQIRHAYQLTVMTTIFCVSFEKIFERFIRCVESDSISTRNKGLKAIKQLIEKDPSILDRQQTVQSMMTRSEDPSAQVRDSAVDMIGTCLSFKPGLEDRVLPFILQRVSDTNVGVRKRAMRVSKEIYLRSDNVATKVRVAETLMLRVKDLDATVAELAKKTFEELWINPSYAQIMKPSEDQREVSTKAMMIIKDRIDIIVKVAQGQEGQAIMHLNNVIQAFLDPENKQSDINAKVCKIMVQALFDELLEQVDDNEKKDKQFILKTLTAFAQGSARLFNVQQLETLQPYTENLSQQDDLFMYRSVIIIFRCVLPSLSASHQGFLMNVAKALLTNLSHLSHRELKEVVYCLAAINKVQDINPRLVAVICSCFASVAKAFRLDTNACDKATLGRFSRFIYIMGLLGMYCDFEKFKEQIRARLKASAPGLENFTESISQLVVDTLLRFCKPNVEMSIRKSALESLGHVCKTHPGEYLRPQVLEPLNQVFASDDADLKKLVLNAILDFFMAEEKLSEDAAVLKGPAASKESVTNADFDPGRLTGATAFAVSHDGVSTSLAQNYLKSIVKISLASNDEYALTAVEVIGSILRQGLVHPKDCTPALIALETSTQPRIEQIAIKEHKTLAAKHESIVERSYMEGVRTAFNYQKNIIGNVEGTKSGTNLPILASLYLMVQSNRKVRKKLLHNMVQSLDFDLTKFDPDSTDLPPIVYSKFMVYNLAFFDYTTIEDVQTVIQALERLVTGTGTAVAHQMESDILQIGKEVPQPIDPQVRRKLCAASIVLMMAWSVRSFLRKLYGFNDPKRKVATKDVTKPATKVQGVSSDPLRNEIGEMTASMDTDLGQDEQCRAFIEMLNVDKDFKLAAENDEDFVASGQEDDSDGHTGTPGGATVPKKRKRQSSPSAKKKKIVAKKHRASSEFSD